MKPRFAWADALRGLLMLLIVCGHAAPEGPLKHYAYSFHVAGFFFLSGYLFDGGGSLRSLALRRARTLLLPYVAFGLISIAVYAVLGGIAAKGLAVEVVSTPGGWLAELLLATGAHGGMKWNLPLWFLPCLYVTQLIAWGSLRLATRLGLKPRAACLALMLPPLLLAFLNHGLWHVTGLPFQLETAVYMLPFFWAGALLRQCGDVPKRLRSPALQALGAAAMLLGGCLALWANPRVDYVASIYNRLTVFYLAAALSVGGWAVLAQRIRSRVLAAVSRGSMAILTMHKFPIVLLQLLLGSALTTSGWSADLLALAVAALSTALCLAVGALLDRFLPALLGHRAA